MVAVDQRDVVVARGDGVAGVSPYRSSVEAVAAPDERRRGPADQPGTGRRGDDRGIHRVVEVCVNRHDGVEAVDAQPGQLPSIRGARRRQRTRCRRSRRLGREKNPSVISAELPSSTSSVVTPAHVTESGRRRRGGWQVEVRAVGREVRPAELQAHDATLGRACLPWCCAGPATAAPRQAAATVPANHGNTAARSHSRGRPPGDERRHGHRRVGQQVERRHRLAAPVCGHHVGQVPQRAAETEPERRAEQCGGDEHQLPLVGQQHRDRQQQRRPPCRRRR